jgi:hypothetical protein
VRLKPGALARVWGIRLITLLFLLVGLFFIFVALETPLLLAFGSDATGRIEQVKPGRTGRSGSRLFDLVFTYQLPGERRQTGHGWARGAKSPAVGQAMPIRVLRIGGIHLAEQRDRMSGSGSCCMGLFVFVWLGLAALFAIAAWRGPVIARSLIRDGQVAAGTIVGKRLRSSGRSSRYQLLYQFPAEGGVQSAVQWVAANAYGSFWEGQPVTVVYDALQPTRSTIYEASDYEVS